MPVSDRITKLPAVHRLTGARTDCAMRLNGVNDAHRRNAGNLFSERSRLRCSSTARRAGIAVLNSFIFIFFYV